MIADTVIETTKKIRDMEIRGAGKIARSAVEALKHQIMVSKAKDVDSFIKEVEEASNILKSARPTAVSLPNAVNYVLYHIKMNRSLELEELKKRAIEACDTFIKNSLEAIKKIGEIGARRISDGDTIMTHCNSKAALSVIKTAFKQGKDIKVIATESRPRYQGHLTVRELADEGIDVTLIVDSAVRLFMKKVDKVIVGADSIAANGAVVNKIGTSMLALAANEARVLFFVAAETYKFSPQTLLGELIEIEERDASEVADPEKFKGVRIRNPAFDVTPPEYIDLIITEKGVIPPQAAFFVIKEELKWSLWNRI